MRRDNKTPRLVSESFYVSIPQSKTLWKENVTEHQISSEVIEASFQRNTEREINQECFSNGRMRGAEGGVCIYRRNWNILLLHLVLPLKSCQIDALQDCGAKFVSHSRLHVHWWSVNSQDRILFCERCTIFKWSGNIYLNK